MKKPVVACWICFGIAWAFEWSAIHRIVPLLSLGVLVSFRLIIPPVDRRLRMVLFGSLMVAMSFAMLLGAYGARATESDIPTVGAIGFGMATAGITFVAASLYSDVQLIRRSNQTPDRTPPSGAGHL